MGHRQIAVLASCRSGGQTGNFKTNTLEYHSPREYWLKPPFQQFRVLQQPLASRIVLTRLLASPRTVPTDETQRKKEEANEANLGSCCARRARQYRELRRVRIVRRVPGGTGRTKPRPGGMPDDRLLQSVRVDATRWSKSRPTGPLAQLQLSAHLHIICIDISPAAGGNFLSGI
jgi:hypothetical protein